MPRRSAPCARSCAIFRARRRAEMPGSAENRAAAGQLALQERSLRKAINAAPKNADARYNLGVILQQLQRHEEAIASFRASLQMRAGADALLNIGVSLHALGRYAEALESYGQAGELDPGGVEGHNNAGNALQALGRHEESLAFYDRAIAANPGYVLAHNNRGNALKAIARYGEAIARCRRALEIDPQDADAHHLIGLTQLCLGEYAQGWQGLEWRWKTPGAPGPLRKLSQPLWHGSEDLRGKSILLQAEQGLGDTIQFARYAPLVAERGATVLLDLYAPLVPLMQGIPGVSRVLAPSDPVPPIHLQCPLLSLPLAFGTTLANIPPPISYVSLNTSEASGRRAKIGGGGGKLVGLCWRRSHCCVAGWGCRGEGEGGGGVGVVVGGGSGWVDWAGSIGTPAWALLNFAPHWVWLTEREDSPWYPRMRLLRQAAPGEWGGVIGRAARM